jgi:ribosome-associated toxin RatA of RatAB toxin-antitoxin module
MRQVRRTAIVPQTPRQMYTIVNDVRRYPEFVPGVPATRVFDETETSIHAAIDITKAGVTLSVATRNAMVPGERIDLQLADGPLRTLEGTWLFLPIFERAAPAIPGARAPEESPDAAAVRAEPRVRGCRVELDVRFEFGNGALTMLFGPMFEASWDSLVDAFVARARELHGT